MVQEALRNDPSHFSHKTVSLNIGLVEKVIQMFDDKGHLLRKDHSSSINKNRFL